jgi:tetratricopeptide (TPR) repeat protein
MARRALRRVGRILLVFALAGWLMPAGAGAQESVKKYPQVKSKFNKRGDVHFLDVDVPGPMAHQIVIRAFGKLELTVNSENRQLGFVEGGRSRGIAGEIVRVWVDPVEGGKSRVEIRNIRISRMGLMGFATTKDWSESVLAEVAAQLQAVPSLESLRARAAAEPDSLDAQRDLLERYLAIGAADEAVRGYEALLAKRPDAPRERIAFADLLLRQKRHEQAVRLLQAAPAPDAETRYALARVNILAGKPADAVGVLSAMAAETPGDVKATYNLGRASFLAGDAGGAERSFSSVVALAPDHPFAASSKAWLSTGTSAAPPDATDPKLALALGGLLAKEGLAPLGREYLARAAAALPDGPQRYEALKGLAAIDLEEENYESVVSLLDPLAKQLATAKQGELLHALSLAYCGLREFPKAMEYNKLAGKANCKPAKDLKNLLETYIVG